MKLSAHRASVYRVLVAIAFFLPFFLSVGCFHPAQTRLPTLQTGPPQVEKKMYERHDPFPDREMGPQTLNRPRGFDLPRAEPRRLAEERALRGLPRDTPTTVGPSSSTRPAYPSSVPH